MRRLAGVVARHRFAICAVVLVAAIVTNIAQFPGIEKPRYREMQAIGRYNSPDIAALTYRTCGWCRQRYGLATALGTLAPGAKVIIPTPSAYTADRATADEIASRLRVFGRAGSIEWVPSAAASGPGFDPTPYLIVTGNGGSRGGPWALAVDPRFLPAGGVKNTDRYLNSIVTGEGPTHSTPVREFALIRWPQPRPGSTFTYQELLVETSLLPPSVRRELTP